ncbi:MAG: class I SAM-dependent methyltransferase, partial [Thermoplasmatota archaeon]
MSPWGAFPTVPAQAWVAAPVDPFARAYDELQRHTWYSNLDPTVQEVAGWLRDGGRAIDYSGGTGILEERLLPGLPPTAGLLNVDASAKFLRLAAEKFRHDPRCAFRLLEYLPAQGRLQTLQEATPGLPPVDGIVCANAVHLYPDVAATAQGWHAALRPGGRLHVQSGNIAHAVQGQPAWLIDGTVQAAHDHAVRLVTQEPRWSAYRQVLADRARMARYDELRRRYFLPLRPLEQYEAWLRSAGFTIERVRHRPVDVRLDEWTRFLGVYHDGILPWVGGTEKIDGRAPSAQAVQDRLD